MWLFDLEGRSLFVNYRAATLLHRSAAELTAQPVHRVLLELGGVPFADRLAFLREADQGPGEVEGCYLLPDGRRLSLLVAESLVLDDDGRPVACVHRLTEGTRRRALVHELSR